MDDPTLAPRSQSNLTTTPVHDSHHQQPRPPFQIMSSNTPPETDAQSQSSASASTETPHDCPGCDRSFASPNSLWAHWSTFPDHRESERRRAQSRDRIERYLGKLTDEKKRDAVAVAIGITAASMLIHVPDVYFRALETLQINAQPATIVPAAAIIRVLQKHVQSTPLTSKQADEMLFAAAVTWLAVEGGHQLASMIA